MALKLYEFQEAGVEFLVKRRRAILADDMGLGKTVQAVVACERSKAERVLVICPNTLKGNWAAEIEKWIPGKHVSVLRGSCNKRKKDVEQFKRGYLVTNIESVRKHSFATDLLSVPWGALIVDEAHGIKNRRSNQTRGVKALAARIPRVYLLTGTPIMNRVDDLWSPLNILYPKRYRSFWSFARRHTIVYRTAYGWEIDGKPIRAKELRREVAPVLLRREKEQVFSGMPRRIDQKVWLDLEGEQLRVYTSIEKKALAQIGEDIEIEIINVLAKLTRCRQATISLGLLGGKPGGVKIDTLMDIIAGTDQKVVVFSQFAKAIKLVADSFKKEGIRHEILIGEIKEVERNKAIEQFQGNPEVRALLATIQAGGAGINLTAASLVVFLDKHWTPAVNEQAIDRTRPHMQKHPVQVVQLLCRNTVDEMIEGVLEGKVSIVEAILKRRTDVTHNKGKDLQVLQGLTAEPPGRQHRVRKPDFSNEPAARKHAR